MSLITRHVVSYAAQECAWQGSGELSVADMVDAWCYAHRYRSRLPTLRTILTLGRLVEPVVNARGLRRVNVRVGASIKMHWLEVPEALESLVNNTPPLGTLTRAEVTEWFRQYEEIHPFQDGNGRTGTLLYNWLRGSLSEPVHAPNLWSDPRRDELLDSH